MINVIYKRHYIHQKISKCAKNNSDINNLLSTHGEGVKKVRSLDKNTFF